MLVILEIAIMKKNTIFALALINAANINATPTKIGETTIEIPAPRGFKRVKNGTITGFDIEKLNKLPSGARRLLWFIPSDNKNTNSLDEILGIDKECNVSVHEKYANNEFSQNDFDNLKQLMKKVMSSRVIEDIYEKNKQRSSKEIGKKLSDAYGTKIDASYGNMIPLGTTDISSSILLTSVMGRAHYSIEDDEEISVVKSSTTGIVYTKNKILQLNCISSENNLEWTKAAVQEWAKNVVKENKNSRNKETAKTLGDWIYKESYDKFRNEKKYIALLPSNNTISLGYPYSENTRLTLEIHGTKRNGHIIIKSNKGMLSCFVVCSVAVRFDDDKNYKFKFESFGNNLNGITLFSSQNKLFFNKLRSSSKTHIEVSYDNNGERQFEFDSGNLIWNHYDFSD